MYGERSRAQMREVTGVHPPFSIFYCGCKQPKSIHILFLRLQRYNNFFIIHNSHFIILWNLLKSCIFAAINMNCDL